MRLQVITKETIQHMEYSDFIKEIVDSALTSYNGAPVIPWATYIAMHEDLAIGSCAFKSAPKDGEVEVTFHTFPEYEGKGIASEMVAMLLRIVQRVAPTVNVIARTEPIKGAAFTVLERNGFTIKEEGGEFWTWVFNASDKV